VFLGLLGTQPSGYAYQWYENGSAIGDHSDSYYVQSYDQGSSFSCSVTAHSASGSGSPAGSNSVAIRALPVNTSAPAVSGNLAPGETLTCDQGAWEGSPTGYAYQWYRDGEPVEGATSASYLIGVADEGHSIGCSVTASNSSGAGVAATSERLAVPAKPPVPTGVTAPAISGAPAPGKTLTCDHGGWEGSPTAYAYIWERDGSAIEGATSPAYVVLTADEGKTLECVVTASNGSGAGAPASSADVFVPAAKRVPDSPPVETSPPAPQGETRTTPVPGTCADQGVVLVSLQPAGHAVLVSGVALPSYAGQEVTITASRGPSAATLWRGSARVTANGTFAVKVGVSGGPHSGLTRYTASVAGHASGPISFLQPLRVLSSSPTHGGLVAHLQLTGQSRRDRHLLTVSRQVSCGRTVPYKTLKLDHGGRASVLLPAARGVDAIAYYRFQTKVHGRATAVVVPVPAAN
jgi:hypothetical protein